MISDYFVLDREVVVKDGQRGILSKVYRDASDYRSVIRLGTGFYPLAEDVEAKDVSADELIRQWRGLPKLWQGPPLA